MKRPAREQITQGSLPKAALGIALPTWGAFITHDMMGTVDMLFVGRLGAAAVAAVAISGMFFGIIIMLAQGITSGTTALVSISTGRDDHDGADLVLGQSLVMAIVVGFFISILGVPLAGMFLRVLGGEPEVVALGAPYLKVTMIGAIVMIPGMAFGSALRGAGDASTPFRAMVLGNVVNVVLDPILIFGLAGFPKMGVVGSAWATIVGRAVGMVILLHAFHGGSAGLRLRARDMVPQLATMKRVVSIGVFASLRGLVRNIFLLVLTRLVAQFGTVAVAGYGIVMRLRMFVMGPSMGFGTAAATIVGQNLGAGQPERARYAGWLNVGLCSVVILGISVVYWVFSHPIVGLFNTNTEVILVGSEFLKWFSASFLFMSVGLVLGNAISGAGDTVAPMIVTGVVSILVGIPAAYGLAWAWGNETGIWAAISLTNVVEGLAFAGVFHAGRWEGVGMRLRDAMSAAV